MSGRWIAVFVFFPFVLLIAVSIVYGYPNLLPQTLLCLAVLAGVAFFPKFFLNLREKLSSATSAMAAKVKKPAEKKEE